MRGLVRTLRAQICLAQASWRASGCEGGYASIASPSHAVEFATASVGSRATAQIPRKGWLVGEESTTLPRLALQARRAPNLYLFVPRSRAGTHSTGDEQGRS